MRIRKVSTHRFLDWFGTALAALMVPIDIITGIVMARFDIAHYTMPDAVVAKADIQAFLAIPFWDMLAFPILVGFAILWRKKPELHRRLLFIATCCLMDAPFGRYAVLDVQNRYYAALDVLILLGMMRDLIVDRHVHKVYSLCAAAHRHRSGNYHVLALWQSTLLASNHACDFVLVQQ